jgi:hypothetical protein
VSECAVLAQVGVVGGWSAENGGVIDEIKSTADEQHRDPDAHRRGKGGERAEKASHHEPPVSQPTRLVAASAQEAVHVLQPSLARDSRTDGSQQFSGLGFEKGFEAITEVPDDARQRDAVADVPAG